MRERAVRAVATGVLVFVAAIAGLGAGIWRAQELHRRAVLTHLDYLAAVAVDRYSLGLEAAIRQSIAPIFPVLTVEPAVPEPPEYMLTMVQALRHDPCGCLADLKVGRFFTLRSPGGEFRALDSLGRRVTAESTQVKEIAQFADTTSDTGYLFALFLSQVAPGSVVVLSSARTTPAGDQVRYGFSFPRGRLVTELAEPTFRSLRLVPRYLADTLSNSGFLSLSLTGPDGSPVYRTSPTYPPLHLEVKALPGRRGHMRVEAEINPALADQLVPGGVPTAVPLKAFALLALALACLGAVVIAWLRAQQLARMRTNFAAGISHELRTPLTQIRLASETLLLGRSSSPANHRAILLSVVDETRRLQGLIDNVLLFSRAERRAGIATPSDQPLGALLREVVADFAPLAERAGSRLEVVGESDVIARYDPGALRQILLNLLDNAIKYGPRGQTVLVATEVRHGRVEVTVSDEGPGIAPSDRERAWLPFVRLDRGGSTHTGGAGLGLAVVRGLLAASGGSGQIEDRPGGGTVIRLFLPKGSDVAQELTG